MTVEEIDQNGCLLPQQHGETYAERGACLQRHGFHPGQKLVQPAEWRTPIDAAPCSGRARE